MNDSKDRKLLIGYVGLLVPAALLAARFDPYRVDGDAVSYMDISDLIRSHSWAGVVNGYWHPLYPLMLALARSIVAVTPTTELNAYYLINAVIFLCSVAAMLFFMTSLDKLRCRLTTGAGRIDTPTPLLSVDALRMLGVGLLVVGAQRELSVSRIGPDALLQTLMLAAFGFLLQSLASERLLFAPLMGLFLGFAYLTKSFAFLIAVTAILTMMLFQSWIQRRRTTRVLAAGALAFATFAAVAGPYAAALSRQKHRLDFGDSGALAYAWFSAGTEKMHLEPWMTGSFGSSTVKLTHPEKQLSASPGIYSYKAEAYGTYPPWFDTTFFNERVQPHLNLRILIPRIGRNLVLCVRYLFDHPEGWIALSLLVWLGGRLHFGDRKEEAFWAPAVWLGLIMVSIYGLVLIEDRYVTFAYLCILLPAFAMLTVPRQEMPPKRSWLPFCASALVVLMSFLALGQWVRNSLVERRWESGWGLAHGWLNPQIFGAAAGLHSLGVQPGDEIACIGAVACVNDNYWARIAQVRILTEVYFPEPRHLVDQLAALPNLTEVYSTVRGQGARVLVGSFDPGEMNFAHPASAGWVRLGETNYYAYPLNVSSNQPPRGDNTR